MLELLAVVIAAAMLLVTAATLGWKHYTWKKTRQEDSPNRILNLRLKEKEMARHQDQESAQKRANLDVRLVSRGRGSKQIVLTNQGPATATDVTFERIDSNGAHIKSIWDDQFPLAEFIRGSRMTFLVATNKGSDPFIVVRATWVDDTGQRQEKRFQVG